MSTIERGAKGGSPTLLPIVYPILTYGDAGIGCPPCVYYAAGAELSGFVVLVVMNIVIFSMRNYSIYNLDNECILTLNV